MHLPSGSRHSSLRSCSGTVSLCPRDSRKYSSTPRRDWGAKQSLCHCLSLSQSVSHSVVVRPSNAQVLVDQLVKSHESYPSASIGVNFHWHLQERGKKNDLLLAICGESEKVKKVIRFCLVFLPRSRTISGIFRTERTALD